MLKRANGLERDRRIFKPNVSDDVIPNSWSADGSLILFTHQSTSGYHLELIPATGGNPTPFQTGPGNQANGMISPDGKFLAYSSDESGDWEIYVTTFPGAAGKWQSAGFRWQRFS